MNTIVAPSDFKILIHSIADIDGNEISFTEHYLVFDIADNYGNHYKAIHDNNGQHSQNTRLSEDGLYIIMENYKLKGLLKWQVGTKTQDDDFADGEWNWWGEYQELCINIK